LREEFSLNSTLELLDLQVGCRKEKKGAENWKKGGKNGGKMEKEKEKWTNFS